MAAVGGEKHMREEGVALEKRGKVEPRRRPLVTEGRTYRKVTGCGSLYITINKDEHGICEVFTRMGKVGGCSSAQAEAVARMVSIALRANVKPSRIADELVGIRCTAPIFNQGERVFSCPDAIGQAMLQELGMQLSLDGKQQELPMPDGKHRDREDE